MTIDELAGEVYDHFQVCDPVFCHQLVAAMEGDDVELVETLLTELVRGHRS